MYPKRTGVLLFLLLLSFAGYSQLKKYPSLLWEITGNGLKKPSYLFGTMHVSSKMVFNLPDTFYYAIQNVESVALELNPDVWQGQMVKLDQLQANYRNFIQPPNSDYLNEKSFRIQNYEDELKSALSSEPTVVNSLLYRSYKSQEDFEEDTFLDLYIFQTGKKLGKKTTGVENYFETEKIVMEAYADMAKEKKQKTIDTDGESLQDIEQKTEDAYRTGNLDLLDSLDNMMQSSDAFRDKFLYKRNEIQANSIDTILKKNSLFVGVGAAHLAGKRGVIELLRKMGYSLRPVMMSTQNTFSKEQINKMKVPVLFTTNTADDGMYKVEMPGPLYKMATDVSGLDRRQYADMSNGAYYMLTRVKTHAAFLGLTTDQVLKKVDSLLYENIPGKILQKNLISKNGYSGYDIINKTRRGDIQRYQIFATPFEVLVFKMSGNENYAQGPEAEFFFSSIKLKEQGSHSLTFEPSQGGFKVELPQQPNEYINGSNEDRINSWVYETFDKDTKNAFYIARKSVNNFRFLEEDTFDLDLMAESFRSSAFIEKQLQRHFTKVDGYPALDEELLLKDGGIIKARFIIRGPQYYLLAAKSKDASANFKNFFSSFKFTPFRYREGKNFVDTFLNYTVVTPVIPELEENFRALVESIYSGRYTQTNYEGYWPKAKNALFKNDSTGEVIAVAMQQFPKYYYAKDSSSFWKDEIKDYLSRTDFILAKKDSFLIGKDIMAYRLSLRDTNSSRQINRLLVLKNDRLYRIITLGDTLNNESDFVKKFYSAFRPIDKQGERSIFKSTVDQFLKDFYSADSATHAKAQASISNVFYRKNDIPKILKAIRSLKYSDKDYFDTKTRFISELSYINDTTANREIVNALKDIYYKAGDTSTLQNAVIKALAKNKTKDSYTALKDLLLHDPPVFENNFEYVSFFNELEDSLTLARQLFPGILQLSTISDYKDPINSLLVTLVDSNLIRGNDYRNYFTKIYFDARIELKKQQIRDEKKAADKDEPSRKKYNYNYSIQKTDLDDYAVLLMPFYDKPEVKDFFHKLLYSQDSSLQLSTTVLLLRNKLPAPENLISGLAKKDIYRAKLYKSLEEANLLNKFPSRYKQQVEMARSILTADKSYTLDSVVFLSSRIITFRNTPGRVYFFKYRLRPDDDWKIGISGLQPEKQDAVNSNNKLVRLTEKRIKDNEPLDDQLDKQLKHLLFSLSKSGRNFYEGDGYNRYRGGVESQ